MAPTTTRPVLIPIRIRNSTPCVRRTSVGERLEPLWIARAALSARWAWSSCAIGRPEQRHHAVAEELVDRPFVAMHFAS